ncbi:4'-phosphopantetheinyl transferase superfamily protein [Staphylococcus aureus]|nr:4'-phosphopantetheinyl transferase superfamily protein [Staphylococcus aureus]
MAYKKYIINSLKTLNVRLIKKDIFNGLTVIIIALTNTFETNNLNHQFLTIEQSKKLKKFLLLDDINNYLISHSIVNSFFCSYINCRIEDLHYSYNKYFKPYIKNNDNIKFNISHTLGCSVIALSKNEVGVDIENKKREIEFANVVDSYFNDYEKLYINNESDKFYEVWVAKEAYLKCKGCGLMEGLTNLNIVASNKGGFYLIDENCQNKFKVLIDHIYDRYVIGIVN